MDRITVEHMNADSMAAGRLSRPPSFCLQHSVFTSFNKLSLYHFCFILFHRFLILSSHWFSIQRKGKELQDGLFFFFVVFFNFSFHVHVGTETSRWAGLFYYVSLSVVASLERCEGRVSGWRCQESTTYWRNRPPSQPTGSEER